MQYQGKLCFHSFYYYYFFILVLFLVELTQRANIQQANYKFIQIS